ncbi:hypothetical protein ACEQUB_03420 [Ralstonia syzygii]|nr:OPT/YSL family transporter [Ralstonia syzygii]
MQSFHPPKPILAAVLPELTLRGMVLGAVITVIFTASNVYLGLKVGLTFSSAIPAAVISMAVLRAVGGSNILENNMVQTQASAAGTLSSVIFILPGLVMIGHWQGFPFWQTFGVCMAGGIDRHTVEHSVHVHRDWRGKGAGSRLMEALRSASTG